MRIGISRYWWFNIGFEDKKLWLDFSTSWFYIIMSSEPYFGFLWYVDK